MTTAEPLNPELCLSCHESLPEVSKHLTCSDCGYGYHAGPCSGENTVKGKTKNSKNNTWKCQTCLIAKNRGGQSTEKQTPEQVPFLMQELAAINKKLAELMTINAKVDSLMLINDTVDQIEKSTQLMSNQYDEILKKMNEQSKEITDLKKRVEKVEGNQNDEEISKLKKEVNSLEQYSRRQNLEIHGLPSSAHENLLTKLNDLAGALELPKVTENDVEGLHRLPAKPGKAPAVLVRFASRVTREHWVEKRQYLKNIKSDIWFQDNLTAMNKKLLWMLKEKAAEKEYQFAWQKNGNLFARKKQGDRAIKIESEADLDKIV